MKRLLALIISLLPLIASAQRIVGELESNSDKTMVPGDSTDDKKKQKKIVPVDIHAWTIDDVYGNRTPVIVDTIHHQYQNKNHNEGANGHFNHLGNLGSPRQSRIFMERNEKEDFIFLNPFSQFYIPADQFIHYNTKSPFLNANYNCCGSKTTGDDHIKVIYTNNAGKRLNIGGLFDYIYGQGYYNSQSTSFMNASAWASYIADRYDFHFQYTHNYMKMAENGGISEIGYITHPEEMDRNYASSDIPTWLNDTWMKQEHDIVHFNHHYNIGFTRTEGDSTDIHDVFVPVTSIFHTFELKHLRRGYIAFDTPDNYHTNTYLPGDSANDRTKNFSMKNIVGLSLREGFNKYAAAGLNAYVGFEHKSYEMQDTFTTSYGTATRIDRHKKYKDNNILIGGQLIRTQGTFVHYDLNAEYTLTGDESGDFKVIGRGELNLPFKKDTMQLVVNAYIKNLTPSYYIRHYHSKHAWWDYDLDKETRTRIEGIFTLPRTRTKLTVGIENMKNYTYFENTGNSYPLDGEGTLGFTNNITPRQCPDNIQVVSANLRQDFTFGIFHLDNDITFQTCTNKDVLPLPTLSLYHNLYITFKIAKVLNCELGGDVKYFTEYYAPDYSPIMSQFMVQNKANRTKIGNYPIASIYANFDLKRTRFYVQYYHLNQGAGHYFWAPGYAMNPKGLHLGISWNFYD